MEIRKVGVVGCGLMGFGIAQAALSGLPVVVRKVSDALLERGLASIEENSKNPVVWRFWMLWKALNTSTTSVLEDGCTVETTGLVHRDIKPGNIFLTGSGWKRVACIGDYGLVKAFESAGLSGLTRLETVMGSCRHIARQQVINYKYCEPVVDVWAMGASPVHDAHALLSSRLPCRPIRR